MPEAGAQTRSARSGSASPDWRGMGRTELETQRVSSGYCQTLPVHLWSPDDGWQMTDGKWQMAEAKRTTDARWRIANARRRMPEAGRMTSAG
jgi:hypothetical protein